MEDEAKLVSSIESKVNQLIRIHREQEKKLAGYQVEIAELKKWNQEQQLIIEELKQKNILLRIAKTTEKKEGSVDAKLRINELIREIDRCIGLLQV